MAGHFQEYRDPGRLFGKGWIELAFDRLVLPGAVTLPLSAKVVSVPHLRVDGEGRINGRGHPKRDALGWAVPILWPVKVVTLPARGPRPTLKGEVRIALRLLEDVEVPATVIAPRTVSSMPAEPQLRPSGTAESSSRLRWQARCRELRPRKSRQSSLALISPTVRPCSNAHCSFLRGAAAISPGTTVSIVHAR